MLTNEIKCAFDMMKFVNLFYSLIYFCYYLWALLHFLVLFIGLNMLFQLIFTFIYIIFSKKISILAKLVANPCDARASFK